MLTAILVMYLIVGVVFTLVSISGQIDLYDQNDMITKGAIVSYLVLGWPYYAFKVIRMNLKNC